VIKSFLILVLGTALAIAGVVTRPSEQSARSFLASGAQPTADSPKSLGVAVKDVLFKSAEQAKEGLPAGYEFKDRVLWVEVVKDGQTVYTGALAHWIKHEPKPAGSPSDPGGTAVSRAAAAQAFR
jgi:hypothetical protein